ncbi:transcriptional regulator ATRX homolog isoform X2 [Phlebotomus papatasi]|uniref:transcriptional regulator ATRX homolog isoform X2 n=1 Tax=Phlebotomus papatasi TaxID=29031 RepID=UPI0024837DA0|nr:transcriptional regulator ATRX homolog isoform X2 [Phlebotomus papatasi]
MDDSSVSKSIDIHQYIESVRESLTEACSALEKSKEGKNSDESVEDQAENLLKTLLEVQTKVTETIDRARNSVKNSVSEWKGQSSIKAECEDTVESDKPKIRLVALEKLQDPSLLSNSRAKPRVRQRPPPRQLNKSSIVISDSSDDEPVKIPPKPAKVYPSQEVIEHAKCVKVQVQSLSEDLSAIKRQSKVSEIRNIHGVVIENLGEASKEPIKLIIKKPTPSEMDKGKAREKSDSVEEATGSKKKTRTRNSEEDFLPEEPRKTRTESKSSEDSIPFKRPSRKKTRIESKDSDQEKESDEDILTDKESDEEPISFKKKPSKYSDDEDYQDAVENLNSDSEADEKVNGNADKGDNSDNSTDSEIIINPKKRKRAQSNSSKDSMSDDSDSKSKNTRKRRIKRPKNSDSSDDEKNEKGDKSNKRKNIRKVIKDTDLEEDTKKAAREESERKKRIEERQKLYNSIYEEKDEVKELEKVVLDFDEESKEELLSVHPALVKKLKPHQGTGIKFMWDACFETLERTKNSEGSGCILAHCMGLGKTLQVIALTHTLLTNSEETGVKRVLVICPLSTVLNWVNEFHKWLEDIEDADEIDVYELSKFKQNNERGNVIKQWHNGGGVLVIGYDLFRNLSNEKNRNIKKKAREAIQMGLITPGPELVICDEGHLLKNEKTSISKAVNKIRTLRRIVLTGTPLQNNLKEYYCMVQFVKPNLLGKYIEYMNRFVNPITNGQYIDSTPRDIQVMKRRSHVLHKMLDGCVQRRDYSVLAPFLPPKHEYVVFIRLTELQIKLYKFYMENKARNSEEGQSKRTSILFADFQNLQRIWTHPRVLRYNSDRYEVNQQKKREMYDDEEESVGSLKDFIDDESSTSSSSDEESGSSKGSDEEKQPVKRLTRTARTITNEPLFTPSVLEQTKMENPTEWWVDMVPEADLDNLKVSGKLMLLFSILEECEAIGDKLLVFSQSLFSLDVIEHFLALVDDNEQAKKSNPLLAGFAGSWALGLDYFRLDGSTTIENRNIAIKAFNRVDNHRARLFLISTKAGGLGVNLVAANRVVIFDASWNPSHDVQSIFRVYRFGQVKPCYIYRFLAMGTMEEKIYERQVTKQAISKRVIDEQQIDRHYREHDLMLLYKYELEPEEPRETPRLPKDRLFADMLTKYEDVIYKYHEHDSLLENKEEETLNEEERRAAWEEYENEKKRAPVINYGMMNAGMAMGQFNAGAFGRANMAVTSNNYFGFRGDIFLRLLDYKARQDHPEFDEMEIKQHIPILVQQMYNEVSIGDMTTYNSLILLQQDLVDRSPMVPNIYQGHNSHYTGGSSGSMVINPFHSGHMNRQNYRQNNQLRGNTLTSDNGVINID